MKTIGVSLKDRSYRIKIGPVKNCDGPLKQILGRPTKVIIVSTEAIKEAGHVRQVSAILRRVSKSVSAVILPNGESQKNLTVFQKMARQVAERGLDRKSLVVTLGGGVVTDMGGFLAATYMRGIPYVSIPTTLLGMVDASIGGKTGVDLPEGKNLIGAFYQPKMVWIDPSFLRTLPKREWKTGFAEIIKYGVIANKKFFEWLEKKIRTNPDVSSWDNPSVERAIYESVRIKARVVSADEKERPLGGGREILNFGHTIGHALEAAKNYRGITHGEAISIGMVCAGQMARWRGLWSDDAQIRLLTLFDAVRLPISPPKLKEKEKVRFWTAIFKDKKNVDGQLRFVLPVRHGKVVVKSGISAEYVKRVMNPKGTLKI